MTAGAWQGLLLFVGYLTSQQQASVSQGRICSDNFTCCHTEIEVADQTFYLTQSRYTDTGPTSPSADPIMPSAWQGSHWSANFLSHWYDSTPKKSRRKRDSNPGPSALEADVLPLGQRGGTLVGEALEYKFQANDMTWPGATRGVTVSMSAFLACHQCCCAGLSLAWGLNRRAVVCGIFWSSSPGVFSGHSGFLPSFIGLMLQPIK